MTKQQLAEALAEALNILNGIQAEMEPVDQAEIHTLLSTIPVSALDAADFRNNGTITATQLIKAK